MPVYPGALIRRFCKRDRVYSARALLDISRRTGSPRRLPDRAGDELRPSAQRQTKFSKPHAIN